LEVNPAYIVLALSMAGNAALGWAYLGQRDKATEAKTVTVQTTAVAVECSEGTAKLETKAVERKAVAAPKIEKAKKEAEQHNKEADKILATPPADASNVCASAQALVDDWWEKRK